MSDEQEKPTDTIDEETQKAIEEVKPYLEIAKLAVREMVKELQIGIKREFPTGTEKAKNFHGLQMFMALGATIAAWTRYLEHATHQQTGGLYCETLINGMVAELAAGAAMEYTTTTNEDGESVIVPKPVPGCMSISDIITDTPTTPEDGEEKK